MDKRYKSSLDSTRVRQRKLYRFSRFLRQLFENATEYNLGGDIADDFFEALLISDHFLITSNDSVGQKGVYLIAHHALGTNMLIFSQFLELLFAKKMILRIRQTFRIFSLFAPSVSFHGAARSWKSKDWSTRLMLGLESSDLLQTVHSSGLSAHDMNSLN